MRKSYLMLAVFIAGMATLAIELSASRLLGTVYGTSNIVWANIIGLILVYLSAGYFLGGRWADRWPFPTAFYRVIVWAGFTAGLVPVIAQPVLLQAARSVERLQTGLMVGSFISVLLLFSVPVTLLGCVSPYAIRLAIEDREHAGRTSGRIYALSTLGSIFGTFLPVLVLIPRIGTANTFVLFSLMLIGTALVGLFMSDRKQFVYHLWMPLVILGLAALTASAPIKDSVGQIYEVESGYNYIQVVERDGVRMLMLNEGQGIHSIYAPGMTATYGTWDYFLAAPFFYPPETEIEVKRVGIVGLAAGTIAKQYTEVFGPVQIDGWEIDPMIIEVGRRWFDMNEANLNAIAQDGRWGIAHSPHTYTVIGVDAYRLPYIPFHLTTVEFFEILHDHLDPQGTVVINVGRTPQDRRIIEGMVGTLQVVFESVHVVDVPQTFNTIIFATTQPTSAENLVLNELELEAGGAHPLLVDVLRRSAENLKPTPDSGVVFTDDRAPIEQLTNAIALRFVLSDQMDLLR
ncbi:MAG: fused MFS/spermidine synthase [Anaerolineales bacterium]|nr:fused MFS/spermidine synthase [Anaerolineales bacterium]